MTNVAKTGVGTWVLTGANTYGGWTHIDAGTLRITTSEGLGAGGFDGTTMTVIANNAALELQGDLTITEHFHLQGAGPAGLGVLRSLSGNTSLTTNFALDNNSTFGVDAGTLTIASTIYQETGSCGVTKVGAGTLVLSGNNSYTGDTSVNAGTLSVTNNSATTFPDTSTVSIAATAVLDLPNAATDVVAALVINGTAVPNGVYDSSSPATTGYITGAGKLQVGASTYAAWAALNAGGGQADGDSDLDGLPNGIEYFMNAAAGFTANPQVVTVGGVSSITWPNGGNIPFTDYGTQFVVQTSADLTIWTDVPSTDGNLSNTSGAVTYTLPNGAGTIFVRLSVTPN